MAVPRMLALAEVLWTPKEKRNEADFIRRLDSEFPRLGELNVNASKSLYQVTIKPKQGPKSGQIAVEMSSATGTGFSLTKLDPPYDESTAVLRVYSAPVVIDSDSELWGWLQREGLTGPISKRRFEYNLATAQKITLSEQPNERYNEGGAFTLVDGITAQEKRVNIEWLGWRESVTITVDLGSEQDISSICIGALNETHSWIHVPNVVEFSVSNDGKTFTHLGVDLPTMNEIPLQTIDAAWRKDKAMRVIQGRHEFTTNKTATARYVRINVQHIGNIPEGYPGAGNPAWMFLDEIEVR
jgi:hexosaminidase